MQLVLLAASAASDFPSSQRQATFRRKHSSLCICLTWQKIPLTEDNLVTDMHVVLVSWNLAVYESTRAQTVFQDIPLSLRQKLYLKLFYAWNVSCCYGYFEDKACCRTSNFSCCNFNPLSLVLYWTSCTRMELLRYTCDSTCLENKYMAPLLGT